MKPWFNTALILMLTLIWMIIGFQLHKRLSHVELRQSMKPIHCTNIEHLMNDD